MQHSRRTRFVAFIVAVSVATFLVECALACPRDSCARYSPPRNHQPTINCPTVAGVFYADKGSVTVSVYWPHATGHDIEDGYNVNVRQTQGQHPGTEHSEGTYTVTYQATDTRQTIATCSFSFSVIVHRCSMSGTSLLHGTASCQPADSKNIYGSVCAYVCDPGYVLNGSSQAECRESRTWSALPFCQEISCGPPQTINRGHLKCGTQGYTYRSQCVVSCDAGYAIEKNDIITCQADKKWTTPGQCVDKEPPRVLCGSNIEVFAGPKRTPAAAQWPDPVTQDNSGGNVTLACDRVSGSVFELGQTKVTCTGTDEAKNTASCSFFVFVKEKLCLRQEAPDNSDITCSHENTYGSECTVTCHQAYLLNGPITRICQNNQTWSGGNQSCTPRSCAAPPTVSHGYYECLNGMTYQTSCPLICDKGYRPIAPLTITCDINIQWTQKGSCFDVTPPSFPDGCPADKYVIAASFGEPTYVSYQLPRITDNSGESITAMGDPASGFAANVGSTTVTIIARDSQGNNASCQFVVEVVTANCSEPRIDRTDKDLIAYNCSDGYVLGAICQLSCKNRNPLTGASTIRCTKNVNSAGFLWTWSGTVVPYCNPTSCEKLRAPLNGALACDSSGGGPEICVVMCNEKYMYPSTTPELYTCFPSSGLWRPINFVPNCTVRRTPGSVFTKPAFYYFTDQCSNNITAIQDKFLQVIENSNFKTLCTGDTECYVSSVEVTCGPTVGSRKKRATDSYEYKITLTIVITPFKDFDDSAQTLDYYVILVNQINEWFLNESETGRFSIPSIGQLNSYFNAESTFNCTLGTLMIPRTMSCAGCGEGHMYDNRTNSCVPCPRGTYQNQEISFSCTPCPGGTTTKDIRSTSAEQCLDFCIPGEFSDTGIKPCELCSKGSFQSWFGGIRCDLCPWGMSTLESGRTANADCRFFNIRMTEDSQGPIIQLYDPNPRAFTIATRVHTVTSSPRTTFTFGLDFKSRQNGTAFISLDDAALIISPVDDYSSRSIRKDQHVAMVFQAGNMNLYVDGIMTSAISGVSITELHEKSFIFTPSKDLKYVVLSHFQMTDTALQSDRVRNISVSCNERMDKNILVVDAVDGMLITPSTCDDINNCVGDPCGQFGTCVNEFGRFSCLCDEPWSGDTCQVALDFCMGHKCGNGAKCVNQPEYRNYSCACTAGYSGILCERPVANGGWGNWNSWSLCSVTCGQGQRSRSRLCDNPKPDPEGRDCVGNGTITEACTQDPCPVDCRWSQWSAWACSSTCGAGLATKTRQHEQEAQNGGEPCHGPARNIKACEQVKECPVDGKFGQWAEWSACSVTCGGGVSIRHRQCDNPPPSNGGKNCNSSELSESRTCGTEVCPVCKPPEVRKDIIWNCTTNNDTEMTICQISCPELKQMVPAQTDVFQCGPLTNYTWTHQTEDNPEGLLPTCTDMKIPSAVEPTFTLTYEGDCNQPLPIVEIKSAVTDKLSETECKKTGKCDYSVQTSTTCKSGKRSTDEMRVRITMTVMYVDQIKDGANYTGKIEPAQTWLVCKDGLRPYDGSCETLEIEAIVTTKDAGQKYLGSMSGQESAGLIQKHNDTEVMIQEFVQKSAEASNVTVRGVTYIGKVETTQLLLACPDGSGFYNGFCMDCPAGTYFGGNGICLYCEQGYYQDQVKSSSCKQCPVGMYTEGKGSYSSLQCLDRSTSKPTENKEDSSNIPAIVGAVAGSVCLLLILGGIIVYCVKKNARMQVKDVSLVDYRLPDTPLQL